MSDQTRNHRAGDPCSRASLNRRYLDRMAGGSSVDAPVACVLVRFSGLDGRCGRDLVRRAWEELDGGVAHGDAIAWERRAVLVLRADLTSSGAWVWAERLRRWAARRGFLDRRFGAGVATVRLSELGSGSIGRAETALERACATNGVCTWEMVRVAALASRARRDDASALGARDALLARLGADLGPTQREHLTSHSEEVARIAAAIGASIGFDAIGVRRVEIAALFHDVGKAVIPEGLLAKPGPLSRDERLVVDRHAAESAVLSLALGLGATESRWVKRHHRRFDESRGMLGVAPGIISTADALAAMTAERAYAPARTWETALEEVRREAGGQFHPVAVDAASRLGPGRLMAA